MKNALMIYESPNDKINIGDYIQSLAAKQFINQPIDYYISREHLNTFDKDDVKLIMNGWFTHIPENWPPSSKIHPIFIAFHVSTLTKDKILSKAGVEYLKKHEPIGCRDYDTVNYLKEKGIDAYFTGCLTLTLGLTYKAEKKDDNIYFVDPFVYRKKSIKALLACFLSVLFKFRVLLKLNKKIYGKSNRVNLCSTIWFYYNYKRAFTDRCLLAANYIQHQIHGCEVPLEAKRFDLAETFLRKYAEAKVVITSRLHCALPCLSLGTPVLYVDNTNGKSWSLCRLKGLIEHLNVISNNKGKLRFEFSFENNKVDINSTLTNKMSYLRIRDNLTDLVERALKE